MVAACHIMKLDKFITEVSKQIRNGAKAASCTPSNRIDMEVSLTKNAEVAGTSRSANASVSLVIWLDPDKQSGGK